MKKIIKLAIENTTQIRKTEDSLCELYSHDKNNGVFEFEVVNETLGNEKPYAMFKFMDSQSVWKVPGTIEDNKIKILFDTTLITQDETVVCFLYLDDEERTTDFYRFKFKVKVSEIDKLDTYAVKERYFNNSIIVDKVDVVTKKELEEALKGLTVSSVEGVLTETRADELYAKKTDLYDDTALTNRVKALEERPTGSSYDDTDLQGRVRALEERPNTTAYDDTDVKQRLTNLEGRPDNNTIYDDTDLKRRVSELEQRPDNNTVYDDSALSNRVKALEDAPKVDVTNFATKDDVVAFNRELNNKVSSVDFEAFKTTIPGSYNDSDLRSRVETLETKQDKDTVYDDEPIKERLIALESKPFDSYFTETKANELYAKKTDLPVPYNDKTLSDRVLALENKPSVGQTQDTGWLKVSGENAIAENIVEIRRIANTVHVRFRNENGDFIIVENIYSILDKEISGGFGSITNNSPIFSSKNNRELGRIITNVSNNRITVELSIDVELSVSKSVYINEFSYITDEPFPVQLQK